MSNTATPSPELPPFSDDDWLDLAVRAKAASVYARHLALCGRTFNGVPCPEPAGTMCPDCGPACHDFPEGS